MNPQPPEYISRLFSFGFVLVCAYYVYRAYVSGYTISLNDFNYINLGYVEDSPSNHIINQNFVMPESAGFESQQLYLDCIEALYTLGMKKSEAKRLAKKIFSSKIFNPKSVQEFLTIALRKDI